MSLREVTETGVELDALRALRDRLASELDSCESSRDVAALSARLVEVLKRVAEVEAKVPAAKSALDEISDRRARRKPMKNGTKREA